MGCANAKAIRATEAALAALDAELKEVHEALRELDVKIANDAVLDRAHDKKLRAFRALVRAQDGKDAQASRASIAPIGGP